MFDNTIELCQYQDKRISVIDPMFAYTKERNQWIHQLCQDQDKLVIPHYHGRISVIDPITGSRSTLAGGRMWEYLIKEAEGGLGEDLAWDWDEKQHIQRLITEENKEMEWESTLSKSQVAKHNEYYDMEVGWNPMTVYDWITGQHIILTRERSQEFLTLKADHMADKETFRRLEEAEAFVLPNCDEKLVSYPKRGGGKIGVVKLSSFNEIHPEDAISRMELHDRQTSDLFEKLSLKADDSIANT
jgi:hypothetical protein